MNKLPIENDAEQLLLLARDGDREALGALLKLYRRHLSRFARLQIGPQLQVKIDASDLAQDACLEAHRQFGHFRGTSEAEFGAWIRKILTGLVANSVRRYKGTKQRDVRRECSLVQPCANSSDVFVHEALSRDATPSELAIQHETNTRLAMAMDQLAPHYRQVIDLRNLEDLSFAEVGQQMGRSTDSVEKLWLRAVGKLRRLIRLSKSN